MIRDTASQDVQLGKHQQRKKTVMIWSVIAVLTLALIITLSSFSGADYSIEASKLRTATVKRGNLIRDIAAQGKIVAANAPVIYSPAVGNITLLSNPGESVTQGQIIAELTSPELTNQLKQETASLQSTSINLEREKLQARRNQLKLQQTLELAKVQLEAAKRERRRAEISFKNNVISEIDYEKAQDDLARAKLEFEHAKQETEINKDTLAFELETKAFEVEKQQLIVTELQRQVDNLNIKAPVTGVIGNWLVEQKAQVIQNIPLLTVVDLTAYEAELEVPESYADELGIGMQVEINIGNLSLAGHVKSISPEINNRQVATRVAFKENKNNNLRQNQRVSARILLENRSNVLTVQKGAFMQAGGHSVFVIKDQIAQKQAITLGASSISEVEILQGLQAGDQIIISSSEAFQQAETIYIR